MARYTMRRYRFWIVLVTVSLAVTSISAALASCTPPSTSCPWTHSSAPEPCQRCASGTGQWDLLRTVYLSQECCNLRKLGCGWAGYGFGWAYQTYKITQKHFVCERDGCGDCNNHQIDPCPNEQCTFDLQSPNPTVGPCCP